MWLSPSLITAGGWGGHIDSSDVVRDLHEQISERNLKVAALAFSTEHHGRNSWGSPLVNMLTKAWGRHYATATTPLPHLRLTLPIHPRLIGWSEAHTTAPAGRRTETRKNMKKKKKKKKRFDGSVFPEMTARPADYSVTCSSILQWQKKKHWQQDKVCVPGQGTPGTLVRGPRIRESVTVRQVKRCSTIVFDHFS